MNDLSRAKLADTALNDATEDSSNFASHANAHELPSERTPRIAEFAPRSEIFLTKPIRIAIKTKGKILLVNPADILAVEAEGNYVLLQHQSNSYLLRESISAMAEKLKAYGFIRIHRSVLVNASSVAEISPGTAGECVLRMTGLKEYVVSRTYKRNLKSLAQSWIGIDSFDED
jgi:DNA-binding LytR/AlgR family response regulator